MKGERRDFLKLLGTVPFAFPLSKLTKTLETPIFAEQSIVAEQTIIGPKLDIICHDSDHASPGDRSIWFDRTGSGFGIVGVQQGKPGESYATFDHGQNWAPVSIPVSIRGKRTPSPRFFLQTPENEIVAVHDFSVAIGKIKDKNVAFNKVYNEGNEDARYLQCACYLPDGRIVAAGNDQLYGLVVADISRLNEQVELKERAKEVNFDWRDIYEGIESPFNAFIRTIKYDPRYDVIYYAGWVNMTNKEIGFGVHTLDAKTLKPLASNIKYHESLAKIAINDIEIVNEGNHQLIFLGAERTGELGNLIVYLDGQLIDPYFVNSRQIVEETGGNGIISCASGIKVLEINGEKYVAVSSYSQHISVAKLADFINQDKNYVNWLRVTQTPDGSRSFGAVHIGVTQDSLGKDMLYSGRIVYSNDAYQRCALIKFN